MNYNEKTAKRVAEAEEEIMWIDIKGYEGLYAVNQFGQVRSYDRIIIQKNGGKNYLLPGRILRAAANKANNVMSVILSNYNLDIDCVDRKCGYTIHALVAEAFLGIDKRIRNKSFWIRRSNDDVEDNYYKNLEKIEPNTTSGTKISVKCTTADNKIIVFKSLSDLSKSLNIPLHTVSRQLHKHPGELINGFMFELNLESKSE